MANTTVTDANIRQAIQRENQKLLRQEQAIATTKAMIAVLEQQLTKGAK